MSTVLPPTRKKVGSVHDMMLGKTYIFTKNGHEYKSMLVSNDGNFIFANGHTFIVNTDTIFYEYDDDAVNEFLKEYELAMNSIECQTRGVTQNLKDAVFAIIENPDALQRMCESNDIFDRVYRQHYVIKKNIFEHESWTPFTSMCQSLLM
jgi:hypothetical protein